MAMQTFFWISGLPFVIFILDAARQKLDITWGKTYSEDTSVCWTNSRPILDKLWTGIEQNLADPPRQPALNRIRKSPL